MGAASIGVGATVTGIRDGAHRDAASTLFFRAPTPSLQRFYDQRLDWQTCEVSFQCALLDVPLDYADPDGEVLHLAVLKNSALDPDRRLGAIVVDPGGPGGSAASYALHAPESFSRALRDRYDVVGMDPRGTNNSDALQCVGPDVLRRLDQSQLQHLDPHTPAEVATYTAVSTAIGNGCARTSPRLGAHVSTVEAAKDLDILRAVLVQPRLDYFGASYGTSLGETYADLFPTHVGRLVLDGADDNTEDALHFELERSVAFESELHRYADDCASEGGCALGDTPAEVLHTLTHLVDRLERDPQIAGGRVTAGQFFDRVRSDLYDRRQWDYLTLAIAGLLERGDASRFVTGRGDDYGYEEQEWYDEISCLDRPTGVAPDAVPALIPRFERALPGFGRFFAWETTSCSGQVVHPTAEPPTPGAAGAPPILVLGTEGDPVTPYLWAKRMAARLDSGVLLTSPGDGHTGYFKTNTCVDGAVEAYLLDGTVPAANLSC